MSPLYKDFQCRIPSYIWCSSDSALPAEVSAQRDKEISREKAAVKDKANTLIQKVLFQNDNSEADADMA